MLYSSRCRLGCSLPWSCLRIICEILTTTAARGSRPWDAPGPAEDARALSRAYSPGVSCYSSPDSAEDLEPLGTLGLLLRPCCFQAHQGRCSARSPTMPTPAPPSSIRSLGSGSSSGSSWRKSSHYEQRLRAHRADRLSVRSVVLRVSNRCVELLGSAVAGGSALSDDRAHPDARPMGALSRPPRAI
jgi:hypothetical protein